MFRIIGCVLLIATLTIPSFAQENGKSILIYTNDQKFLVPLIEKFLRELSIEGTPVFSTVTNLNEINASIKSDEVLREIIQRLSNRSYPVSNNAKIYLKKVADQLEAHDLFLRIYINRIDNVLEYQFYLYNSKAFTKGTSGQFPQNDIVKPVYFTSFIVDINNSNYKDILNLEVKKMISEEFPATNQSPLAFIMYGSDRRAKYYVALNDTITLNGGFSRDLDPVGGKLKYSWIGEERLGPDEDIYQEVLTDINGRCSFVANRVGSYRVFLQVFDGIDYSAVDSVDFIIRQRPIIHIPYKTVKTAYVNYLWEKKKNISGTLEIFCSSRVISTPYLINERLRKDTLALVVEYFSPLPFGKRRLKRNIDQIFQRDAMDTTVVAQRMPLGFKLYFQTPRNKTVEEVYSVGVSGEGNLSSNSEKITVRHLAYSFLSLHLSYQTSSFSFRENGPPDIGTIDHRETRLGLGFNLLPLQEEDGTGEMSLMDGEFSIGIPISRNSTVNKVNIPAQMAIRFKYIWTRARIGISFGLSAMWANVHFENKYINKGEAWSKARLFTGFNEGLEIRPFKRIPLYLNAIIDLSIPYYSFEVPDRGKVKMEYHYFNLGARFNLFQ
ncbi:hypothetical protein [Chitinophaga niabensis]|uniref:Outer membrane protein beta-barrel family protein n=1 Tax=Chitinophaga niabensis TaxID=536979 RepID=A0A1N6E8V2_9BACT|nr:hypothetical protein [Chitinophaga niabensis]SIN79475.1 hypothetical protein SAMN04488055_1396 [Chitinophaga niabensis]